jgi:phage antirepressor YoqD-like protein
MHKNYKKLFLYKYFHNLYKNMLINKSSNYLIYSKFNFISKIGSMLFKRFLIRSKYIHKVLRDKNLYRVIKMNKSKKFNFYKIRYFNFNKYKDEIYNIFIKETLRKEILYLKYNQLFMTDGYKFSNIYLLRLGNIISKIYEKKVEFNIINLKYIHLDSHIFSEVISLKIRNRKNRLMNIIKDSLALHKINNAKKYKYKTNNAYISQYNLINNDNTSLIKRDALHLLLKKIFNISLEIKSNNVSTFLTREKYIYRSIRFRKIRGVRLEAKGRLTKRLTASKSIFKIRYRGSLKNIDTINNFPCVLLRGYLNSNVDYVNLNSKTRNGSFGLKG